jgi:hypothetical protein
VFINRLMSYVCGEREKFKLQKREERERKRET